MKFKSLIFALAVAFAASGAVFAQEPAKKDDGLGTLKGKIFLNYNIDLTSNDVSGGAPKAHGFQLERVYFTYLKDIGNKLSTRVTMDVVKSDKLGGSGAYGVMFIKYAYMQYKDELAGIKTKIQVGQIGNPIMGLADKMGGMRWITKNQMDIEKLNNSADLGAKVSLGFGKIATLSTAYMNGEGYKYIGGDEDKGKSSDTVLTITPINKNLLINAYFKYASGVGTEIQQEMQVGGGVAWMSKLYKVGANYIYETENKDSYIDAWVNVNFNDLLKVPVLFLGRVMVVLPDVGDNTYSMLVGPGYKLNKNAQVALTFGYMDNGASDEMDLAIQGEFKF